MNSSQILNIPIDPTHFADAPPPASEWSHLNRRLSIDTISHKFRKYNSWKFDVIAEEGNEKNQIKVLIYMNSDEKFISIKAGWVLPTLFASDSFMSVYVYLWRGCGKTQYRKIASIRNKTEE